MKLSGLISRGTWDLLERLGPHLDVAIEIFDTALVPQLPPQPDTTATLLRALPAAGPPEDPNAPAARLSAALRTGQYQLFDAGSLHVGVFPLRREREVVALLVTAARATSVLGPPDAHLPERRLERIGWSLRSALESDIATHDRFSSEQQLSRWLATILSFLEHLHACTTDDDLFEAVVQAAAIWGDFDARVYEEDLEGRYRLRAALPAFERSGPQQFPTSVVDLHPGVARISSIAELEAIGWSAPIGELLIIPVPTAGRARRLVAIVGAVDERFERVFVVVCRTLGVCLDRLDELQVKAVDRRLVARLADRSLRFASQAAAVLSELATAVGAAHARLLLRETPEGAPRVLSAVGGVPIADLAPTATSLAAPPDQALVGPRRIALPLKVGLPWPAQLVLIAVGEPFVRRNEMLAVEAARVLEVWLDGALRGLADEARGVWPGVAGHAFETRVHDELERARRFGFETSLLVLDTMQGSRDRHALSLTPVLKAVRDELRASDLIGRLNDGLLAAVLVQTDARGAAAVSGRVDARLRALARDGDVDEAAIGWATYPGAGEAPGALIAAARRELARALDEQRPMLR